jgi:SH3-like domain-containing protein
MQFIIKIMFAKAISFILLLSAANYASAASFGVIKSNEVNLRKGPGQEYPVVAKFVHRGIPVKILNKLDNWYLINDFDGETGWIKSNLVSTKYRNGLIRDKAAPLCRLPVSGDAQCNEVAYIQHNVIFKLISCNSHWCRVRINKKLSGWMRKKYIWGIDKTEKYHQ